MKNVCYGVDIFFFFSHVISFKKEIPPKSNKIEGNVLKNTGLDIFYFSISFPHSTFIYHFSFLVHLYTFLFYYPVLSRAVKTKLESLPASDLFLIIVSFFLYLSCLVLFSGGVCPWNTTHSLSIVLVYNRNIWRPYFQAVLGGFVVPSPCKDSDWMRSHLENRKQQSKEIRTGWDELKR